MIHNHNQNTRFRSITDCFYCIVVDEIKIFFNLFRETYAIYTSNLSPSWHGSDGRLLPELEPISLLLFISTATVVVLLLCLVFFVYIVVIWW